ncbi:acetolactate synthase, partial [bacterium LRH843]|nr:acetolactate synthase [bacterium LRH843]
VILGLGTRFSQITSQDYSLIQADSKLIHVDISEGELNKVYRPALGVVSDVKSFLTDLLAATRGGFAGSIEPNFTSKLRNEYVKFSTPNNVNGEAHVDLEGVWNDLNTILPDNAILTSDAGNFFGWMYRYYSFKQEGTYVGP